MRRRMGLGTLGFFALLLFFFKTRSPYPPCIGTWGEGLLVFLKTKSKGKKTKGPQPHAPAHDIGDP